MLNLRINLGDPKSIQRAIDRVEQLNESIKLKSQVFINRLANEGLDVAKVILQSHIWSGDTFASLNVVPIGENKVALVAESKAILLMEFGSGIRFATTPNPQAAEFGMGPGSFPGEGNWDNPNGWWFPTDDPRLIKRRGKDGQGWGHSYGNPPHMPMYRAGRAMVVRIEEIAREVFLK